MAVSKSWSTELEGLRGIASLWVLLGHICLLVNCHITLLSSPGIGVDLFILLSGYLMTKNYVERKEKEPWNSGNTLKSFWTRRFFRIAPLYYVLLAVALAGGPWFGEMRDIISASYSASSTEASRYSDQSLGNILTHFSFIFGFLPHYAFNTVLPDWSIGLEMQYYLIFPFIMLLVMRVGFTGSLVALLAFCCVGRFILSDYYDAFRMPAMILLKLNIFISGMFLAEAVRRKKVAYVLLALTGPLTTLVILPDLIKLQVLMEVLMIVGIPLVLWPYRQGGLPQALIYWPRKILNNPFSTWLGDVSYSVYLMHLMIVMPAIAILLTRFDLNSHSDLTRFFITAGICLPVVYLLSTLTYKFIEKPGIRLGKRVFVPTPAPQREPG